MTKEEKIQWIINHWGCDLEDGTKQSEVVKACLTALNAQPCTDAISREDILKAFKPQGISEDAWKECNTYKTIMSLPSVSPQEPNTKLDELLAEVRSTMWIGG